MLVEFYSLLGVSLFSSSSRARFRNRLDFHQFPLFFFAPAAAGVATSSFFTCTFSSLRIHSFVPVLTAAIEHAAPASQRNHLFCSKLSSSSLGVSLLFFFFFLSPAAVAAAVDAVVVESPEVFIASALFFALDCGVAASGIGEIGVLSLVNVCAESCVPCDDETTEDDDFDAPPPPPPAFFSLFFRSFRSLRAALPSMTTTSDANETTSSSSLPLPLLLVSSPSSPQKSFLLSRDACICSWTFVSAKRRMLLFPLLCY
jgi:hypothetical protein